MKPKHTLLFYISLLLLGFYSHAQEITSDSLVKAKSEYGLRIGADLSKPLRSVLENGYSGFEIVGDFRFSERFYAAAEIGNEKKERYESNLNSIASGSYVKIGADFNAYRNWLNMQNAINIGLRYGFSSFKQELLAYGIYTTNQTYPGTFRVDPREYTGLTASWLELQVAVKTEILNNLYLSINLQLKRKISETTPDNFDNLFIPGFNRTYDFSEFGAGYGYSLSYLIPIFKK